MIKLGTSPHPKNGREMYEDFFFQNQLSKAHIKLLKNHQQTHNNHSMIPYKPYIKFPTNLQQSSFEGNSNVPVKNSKFPTNQTLRISLNNQ